MIRLIFSCIALISVISGFALLSSTYSNSVFAAIQFDSQPADQWINDKSNAFARLVGVSPGPIPVNVTSTTTVINRTSH